MSEFFSSREELLQGPRFTAAENADGDERSSRWQRIYAVVRHVPAGRVATYGQIAALAGLPRHARQVGYALHALQDETVPWHRVINARGEVSARSEPGREPLQEMMLRDEGVEFDTRGRVDLRRFRWTGEELD